MPVFQEACEQVDGLAAWTAPAEGHKDYLIARGIGSIPTSVHPDKRTFTEPATQATFGGEIDTKCGNMSAQRVIRHNGLFD